MGEKKALRKFVPGLVSILLGCPAAEAATFGAPAVDALADLQPRTVLGELEAVELPADRFVAGEPTGKGAAVPEPETLSGSLVALGTGALVFAGRRRQGMQRR